MGRLTESLPNLPPELATDDGSTRYLVRNTKGLPVAPERRQPGEAILNLYITARDMRDGKSRPVAVTQLMYDKMLTSYGQLEDLPADWTEGDDYVNFPQRKERHDG